MAKGSIIAGVVIVWFGLALYLCAATKDDDTDLVLANTSEGVVVAGLLVAMVGAVLAILGKRSPGRQGHSQRI